MLYTDQETWWLWISQCIFTIIHTGESILYLATFCIIFYVLALLDISLWLVQVREYDRSHSRSPSRDSRRSYSRSRSPYVSRSRSRSLSHSYSGRSRRFTWVASVKFYLVCILVNLKNWSSVNFAVCLQKQNTLGAHFPFQGQFCPVLKYVQFLGF